MEIQPPKYLVKDDGSIIYQVQVDDDPPMEYTVWGICEKGFIHGAGSYLRRKNFGIPYTIISKPTPEEFRRYYELKDKLDQMIQKRGEDDIREEIRKMFDDNSREPGDEWKDLLDQDEDDD